MNQNALNQEIADIGNKLSKIYFNDDTNSYPNDYRAIAYLESDIGDILRRSNDMNKTKQKIIDVINTSYYPDDIIKSIDFDKAVCQAKIRKDFGKALRSPRKANEIASAIGYGFSKNDISELAKIYAEATMNEDQASNSVRKKIIDLLEDCNFHAESGDFERGNCAIYILD